MKKFYEVYVKTNKINLIVVYISEAHARDEWPLSNKFVVNQHKDLNDRLEACKKYIDYFDVPYVDCIYIDNVLDYNEIKFVNLDKSKDFEMNIERTYSCWPERGYVFSKDLKIEYVVSAQIEDLVNWPKEVGDWLEKNVK